MFREGRPRMFRPIYIVAAIGLPMIVPAGAVQAAGQSMVVSATVVESCEMDVEPMEFGLLASADTAGTAQSRIAIQCTPDTGYAVAMDNGLHGQDGQRRMVSDAGTDSIAYTIYRDAAGTQPWTSGSGRTVGGIASDAPVELTAYARTHSATALPGNYRDIVTVTLSF